MLKTWAAKQTQILSFFSFDNVFPIFLDGLRFVQFSMFGRLGEKLNTTRKFAYQKRAALLNLDTVFTVPDKKDKTIFKRKDIVGRINFGDFA